MKLNRTVQRSIDIMTYIAARPEGVSMDEICEVFELPKTSAYDILITLVHTEMLSIKPGTKQLYQTGIASYKIGMSYAHADDALKLIDDELKVLAQKTGRTAFLGKLSAGQVLYILKETPENPIITTATIGSMAPLYCTSLGKTLLAFSPKEISDELLSDIDVQPRTVYSMKTKDELIKDLDVIRQRGYAMDYREYEEHMVCIGAPVYDRSGNLFGAVSASGFYRKDENYDEIGQIVKKKAAHMSRLLGYRA